MSDTVEVELRTELEFVHLWRRNAIVVVAKASFLRLCACCTSHQVNKRTGEQEREQGESAAHRPDPRFVYVLLLFLNGCGGGKTANAANASPDGTELR